MRPMMRYAGLIAPALLSAFLSLPALAAVCSTAASGNWSAAATWNAPCNIAGGPGAGDTVTIGATHTVTLTASAAAASVTVAAATAANGVTLNGYALNVGGAVTMTAVSTNNIASTFNIGAGTLTAASIAINGGASSRVALMTVSSGTITTTGNISFGGTAGNARFTSTGASTVNVGGNFASGGTLTTGGTGTIRFNGGAAQSIGAYITYNNIDIANSAGGVNLLGTTTVGGALAVASGSLNVGGVTLLVNGTTTVAGTLNITSTTGSKTFAGLVTINPGGIWNNSANEAVTFRGGLAHNGAAFNAGTAVQTFDTNSQAISGTLTIPSITVTGVTLTNNGNLTVSTALAGSGGLDNANLLHLNFTGAVGITTLTASTSGNLVEYGYAGTQTIVATTYHHLTLSGSGAKTAAAGLTVNGDLTLAGSASFAAGTSLTHDFFGNWVVNTSAATPFSFVTTSTINFNTPTPAAATSVGGTSAATLAFNKVNLNNTGGVNVNSNISFQTGTAPTLTVATGATLIPLASVIISGTTGTLTGNGTVRVTRTAATADFASQYTIATKTLTNLTVEYIGVAAQTVSALTYGGLKINAASGATLGGSATVNGTLTLTSGTLTVGSNTLTLNGPAIAGTANNLTTTSASSLSFGGSASGVSVPGSVTQLNNLTLNNSSGITLNSSPTLAGTLTLTSGTITTGANKLITSANCPGSVSRSGGFVIGNLQLTFPGNATTTCTYHIGSGTTYAPIGVTMVTPILGGGTLTGSTVGSEHPLIATSAIDANKDANRHWTLWASGDTLNATSYGATFNFGSGDLDISATPTNFVVGRYAGGTWTLPTPVTATSTSTGVSNVSGGITSATSFAVGEAAPVCSIPAGMPPGVTCVCDNFGRASLNPSTINGGNWVLSTSGGSFGLPRIVNPGYLQLTDNSNGDATSATVPGTFPAAGNFISVEFKHYAYNGTGADGIALTLSDSTIAPVPGAFGGSLGFAQKCQNGTSYNGTTCVSDCTIAGGCPGFTGGWIGMAIDEFGNYSNNTEGRLGGPAPGLTRDSVAVRGSGSGMTGYPYLRGTGTLSPPIDNAGSTTPAYGYAYRIMVDARNYTPSNKTTLVSIERDTTGTGSSYSPLVTSFDAFQLNALQADVPVNWVLSFTGSTGSSVNIHEVTGLKVCAQTYVPPAGYRIQVDNFTPSTCTTQPSGKPIVTVAALDTNGNVITDYNKTVTLAALLSGGGASSAVWSKYSANGTLVGNQYTFVTADNGVAKFYLTDSAQQDVYITISENGGTLSSSLATPLQYRGGAFSVANIDALNANPGGGVVAGRPHLMSITRSNGCTIDTTYTGAKNLDGWYTPATGDHPTGAYAPQICAPNVGGTCLPAASSACLTLSIAPPVLSATSNNLPALTFNSGSANFCLVTTDVGKYSLSLRDDSNVGSPITGSSATLTARPFALAVSGIKQGTTSNPGGSGNGGARFITAGDSFVATVGAYLWNSAIDANYDGVPDGGATLAQVTANGTTYSYAWPTTLAAGSPYVPAAGTLNNAALSFTAGLANPTGLDYSEVGSFTISAGASNFLNTAGLNLSGLIFNAAGSQTAGVVGRFYPHHFTVSSTLASACASGAPFTYEDQPFNIFFTLQAQNKNNGQTYNYGVTGYAPVATGVLSLAAEDNNGGQNWQSPRIAWTPPTLSWTNGVFTSAASVPVTFGRAASADGPFINWAAGLKLADNSGDGVPLQGDMNAATAGACAPCDAATLGGAGSKSKMLYGRLLIDNAYGSELLDLSVSLTAQYWNGSAYVLNTDDGCTSLASGNFSQAPGSGAPISTTIQGSGTLAGGSGKIKLTKPSPTPTGKGSVDLSSNLGYLPGVGRETFGTYKSRFIYIREMY